MPTKKKTPAKKDDVLMSELKSLATTAASAFAVYILANYEPVYDALVSRLVDGQSEQVASLLLLVFAAVRVGIKAVTLRLGR